MYICYTLLKVKRMDADLEKILNDLWKKNPHPDYKYVNVKAKLLIVQELRKLGRIA